MTTRIGVLVSALDIMTDGALSRVLCDTPTTTTRRERVEVPPVPQASREAVRAARMKGKEKHR